MFLPMPRKKPLPVEIDDTYLQRHLERMGAKPDNLRRVAPVVVLWDRSSVPAAAAGARGRVKRAWEYHTAAAERILAAGDQDDLPELDPGAAFDDHVAASSYYEHLLAAAPTVGAFWPYAEPAYADLAVAA